MEKYFDINESGCSIRCKLYCNDPHTINEVTIFCHGFGGHKDNRAAARFAAKALSKHKKMGIVTFDWPCHGGDGRKKLLLSDCDLYLSLVVADMKQRFHTDTLYAYATSFGGYMVLKYIAENENPFKKIALRCPAVRMYDVITHSIITDADLTVLASGKPVLAGFDRKIKITEEFLDDLKNADISGHDYLDDAENILILHGTKDEIIPLSSVQEFADNSLIECLPIENADHRFSDPHIMDFAISKMLDFFAS